VIDYRGVQIFQRQADSSSPRKATGIVGAKNDCLIEISERLGIGTRVSASIATIAVCDGSLVQAVARAFNDLRTGPQEEPLIAQLIAVGNGLGPKCTCGGERHNEPEKEEFPELTLLGLL
jgi:hypothetical protein